MWYVIKEVDMLSVRPSSIVARYNNKAEAEEYINKKRAIRKPGDPLVYCIAEDHSTPSKTPSKDPVKNPSKSPSKPK